MDQQCERKTSIRHGWPSGLRRQFKVLFSSGAWVRTPLHAFLAQEDVYRNENVFTLFYFNLFCFSLFYFFFLFFLSFPLLLFISFSFSLLLYLFILFFFPSPFLCFIYSISLSLFILFIFSFLFIFFFSICFILLVQVGQIVLFIGRFISSRIHPFPSEHGSKDAQSLLSTIMFTQMGTSGNLPFCFCFIFISGYILFYFIFN